MARVSKYAQELEAEWSTSQQLTDLSFSNRIEEILLSAAEMAKKLRESMTVQLEELNTHLESIEATKNEACSLSLLIHNQA